ncbi:hypothetical protein [Streptomyces sp. NPDC051219]
MIERQNAQIAAMVGQIADLVSRLEQTTGRAELPGHPRLTTWRWHGTPRS